jgi:hypothetical protein
MAHRGDEKISALTRSVDALAERIEEKASLALKLIGELLGKLGRE